MSVITLTGGQYGSEGKGVIAAMLAKDIHASVRTGGPNAGHSLSHEGRVWKMRSIPCAWVNPSAQLFIGAGAVIDPETLIREVDDLEDAGYSIRHRLFVDQAATIILHEDVRGERYNPYGGPGALTDTIGSTGEGVGYARIRRIRRRPEEWVAVGDEMRRRGADIQVVDTVPMLNMLHMLNKRIMLEGTQGYGLSISFGRWPYVTSANCHAAQLIADTGIGAAISTNLTVFRTYPIRVGGNSGPMHHELTWEDMRSRTGKPDLIEHTTVTGKIRRIGEFDWDLASRAVLVNDPIALALTFADYLDPAVEGVDQWEQLTPPVRHFIDEMESKLGVPVEYVGTGGQGWAVATRPSRNSGDPRSGEVNVSASTS